MSDILVYSMDEIINKAKKYAKESVEGGELEYIEIGVSTKGTSILVNYKTKDEKYLGSFMLESPAN